MQRSWALLKSASSNRWLARQARDPFVKGRVDPELPTSLRARSGFKLVELAKKHRTLLHGRAIVDLGAAPGGWTQVAAAAVKKRGGAVVAVDLLPMEDIPGADFVQGDFFDAGVQAQVRAFLQRRRKASTEAEAPIADTVLSDMMAAMSGVRDRDIQASLDLVSAATDFAHQVLRPADPEDVLQSESTADEVKRYKGGSLVYVPLEIQPNGRLKFFMHPDLVAFRKTSLDPYFARVVTEKPKSSRSESSEAYWVCMGYRGRP